MKSFILAFMLFNSILVFCQDDWVKHNINKTTSVEFPEEPAYRNIQGRDLFTFIDSTGTYQVLHIETDFGTDIQADEAEINKFYEEFTRGLLDGAKGQLITSERISIGEYKAVDCTYSFSTNGMALLSKNRIIAVDNTIYSISYIYLESEWMKNEGYRLKFLNSLDL